MGTNFACLCLSSQIGITILWDVGTSPALEEAIVFPGEGLRTQGFQTYNPHTVVQHQLRLLVSVLGVAVCYAE